MLHSASEAPRNTGALANRLLSTLFLIVAATGIVSCSISVFQRNKSVLQQHFDENTGTNISSLTQPLVFFRERPRLAANARDYVYLGPIKTSRSGEYSYLLWLGIWSTVDHLGRPSETVRDIFETVHIVTDGEPMELGIRAWSGKELGMENAVYSTPVDTAVDAFYVVTRDQIERLAHANSIQIYLHPDASRGTDYRLWHGTLLNIAEFTNSLSDQ